MNYISLPGSGTAAFGNLQNTTNDGTTGRWLFRVDCDNNTICIGVLDSSLFFSNPYCIDNFTFDKVANVK